MCTDTVVSKVWICGRDCERTVVRHSGEGGPVVQKEEDEDSCSGGSMVVVVGGVV